MKKILSALLLLVSPAFADGLIIPPPSLPLSVANGGVDQTAWSTFTPTIACVSGSITTQTSSGRYKAIGKTIFVNINIVVTTIGTCTGNISATLPANSNTGLSYPLAGYQSSATAVPSIVFNNLAYVILSTPTNTTYTINGLYESQ